MLILFMAYMRFFTQFFQGKWIWGICPLKKATEQKNDLIKSRESFLSVTACALYKHFLHKRSPLSLFHKIQVPALPHTREHRFQGHCTAPETTQRWERLSTCPKVIEMASKKSNIQSIGNNVEWLFRLNDQKIPGEIPVHLCSGSVSKPPEIYYILVKVPETSKYTMSSY